MKLKNNLFIWLMLIAGYLQAQSYNNYTYMRKLDGVESQWHSLKLPNDVFSKVNSDFSDLRIIGIKANGDTIEAPYILKVKTDKFNSKAVSFNLINQVKNNKGYYYTFEISGNEFINYINIDFNKSNFDWIVKLEGSQNQSEWFTILAKSRILSINNSFTSYKYTTLSFDKAKFKYVRLFIPTQVNPKFNSASIKTKSSLKGDYLTPSIVSQSIEEFENGSQTEIIIELKDALPVSYLKLNVLEPIDYYRPLTIQYAVDSIKNNTGWHYIYATISSTTLSSLTKNEFRFSNTVMKKIKLIIKNGDNEPLNFKMPNVRGNVYQLEARFNKKATYYLLYGNTEAGMPHYDINRFKTNIPTSLTQVIIGDEIDRLENEILEDDALIKDETWLWVIMISVIFILGWFSIKMIKNK